MKAVPDIAVDRGAGPGEVAHAFGLREPGPVDDTFDAELERARRASGLSFIAVSAPIVDAPAVVAAAGSQPVVAWSSPARGDSREPHVIVGIGVAHELRGTGAARWREVIAGARAIQRARGAAVRPSSDLLRVGGQTLPASDLLAHVSSAGSRSCPVPRMPRRGPASAMRGSCCRAGRYVHDGTARARSCSRSTRATLSMQRAGATSSRTSAPRSSTRSSASAAAAAGPRSTVAIAMRGAPRFARSPMRSRAASSQRSSRRAARS